MIDESIKPVTLITTGRTGTDFFQSLLDNHKSIVTLNGHVYIYEFLERSKCLKGNENKLFSPDIFAEFYWSEIEKFKSKYDLKENKDTLGADRSQSVNVEEGAFVSNCFEFVKGRIFSSKYFVLAVNYAYSKCIGNDVSIKKILFYHYHHATRIPPFLNDFPDTLIVVMTRDPRANFCSGIYNWMKFRDDNKIYRPWFRDGSSILLRILKDYRSVEKYNKDTLVVRLEDLGDKNILKSFSSYIGIEYSDSMLQSTWAGLLWNSSDRVSSSKKGRNLSGFDKNLINNNWESRLWFTEKYLFNTLLNTRLKEYSYKHTTVSIFHFLVSFVFILIPFKYEFIALSPRKLREAYLFSRKEFFKIPLYYLKRIFFCYKYLYREIFKLDKGKFKSVLLKP
jgi:hypothetical protein